MIDEAWEEEQMSNLGCESVSDLIRACSYYKDEVKRLREAIEWLDKLLADADLCNVCGLDYAGYADYEEACKCDEVIE